MKKQLLLVASLTLFSASCAYQPAQSTQAVDDRPQVSFMWQSNADASNSQLFVDGQSFGSVEQYLYPEHSVPVLIGEHVVEIRTNGKVIFRHQGYFGENQDYQLEVK